MTIDEALALLAPSGALPDGNVAAPRLIEILGHLRALDLEFPPAVEQAIVETAERCRRLDDLNTEPPALTLVDLDADDYRERWAANAAATTAHGHAKGHQRILARAAGASVAAAVVAARLAILDGLNGVYVANLNVYWHADDPALSAADRADREALKRHIDRVHDWLLQLAPGRFPQGRDQWWIRFNWSRAAWATFRKNCLPGYRTRGPHYEFATSCGAVPRLVDSYTTATVDCLAAEEPAY